MPFFEGIKYGLILLLAMGPSFFYLLKLGMVKGFKSAAFFALGIALSDLALIIIIFLGFSRLLKNPWFEMSFSVATGILLIGIGIYTLRRHFQKTEVEVVSDLPMYMYTVKGFGINILNPFTVSFWVVLLGSVMAQYDYEGMDFVYFSGGLIVTVMTGDFTKAYLSNKLSNIITERVLNLVNNIMAVVLIIFGGAMIYHFFEIAIENFNW